MCHSVTSIVVNTATFCEDDILFVIKFMAERGKTKQYEWNRLVLVMTKLPVT